MPNSKEAASAVAWAESYVKALPRRPYPHTIAPHEEEQADSLAVLRLSLHSPEEFSSESRLRAKVKQLTNMEDEINWYVYDNWRKECNSYRYETGSNTNLDIKIHPTTSEVTYRHEGSQESPGLTITYRHFTDVHDNIEAKKYNVTTPFYLEVSQALPGREDYTLRRMYAHKTGYEDFSTPLYKGSAFLFDYEGNAIYLWHPPSFEKNLRLSRQPGISLSQLALAETSLQTLQTVLGAVQMSFAAPNKR